MGHSPREQARRPVRTWLRLTMTVCFAGLVVVQVLLGGAVLAQHLGKVPQYGDTLDFLRLSVRDDIPAIRGWLYPIVIREFDELNQRQRPAPKGATLWKKRRQPAALADLDAVQLLQLASCALAIAYFLRAVFDWSQFGSRRWASFGLVLGVLWLDAVVVHFGLAIMADALALSASLAYCGALVDLVTRRLTPWIAGPVLVLSQLTASALRVEKGPVILAVAFLSTAAFFWLARRDKAPAGLARRATWALMISTVTFGGYLGIENHLRDAPPVPILIETILHQRVIYPHLTDIRDALPERTRDRISTFYARRFDEHIGNARRVMDDVAGTDRELRSEITSDMVGTVLTHRWLPLTADTAKDLVENVFATPSFYVRLAALMSLRSGENSRKLRGDGNKWIWSRMIGHHPRWVASHVIVSGLLFVVGLAAAATQWRADRREPPGGSSAETWIRATPSIAFCGVNAAVFALSQDLVQIRYTLFAHVAALALVYHTTLRWLQSIRRTGCAP